MRIAMWSGPRNLSTAMMYSFGNRDDVSVIDEPFYACYLSQTGIAHPMADRVLASQPQDPDEVVKGLLGPIPKGRPYYYQKHMTQHMLRGVDVSWMADVTNVFLIRHPARVAASFAKKQSDFEAWELGFDRQLELFQFAKSLGQIPIVIDSSDIRANPKQMLTKLCGALGIEFSEKMLAWPKGGHPDDGVWAAHWYGAVHDSTGFDGLDAKMPQLTGALGKIVGKAEPLYETLYQNRLMP